MERCVLLTSTPDEFQNVNNKHISMNNPDYNMMPANYFLFNQCTAYKQQTKA